MAETKLIQCRHCGESFIAANARFDFTWDEYLLIHDKQDGKCAICCRDESELAKKLAVDHDHATGRVRGLLCDDCNLAIGRLQDSPKILRRALDYLGA